MFSYFMQLLWGHMKFCKFFLTSINIEPGYLTACCVGGGREPTLPFPGGVINIATYRKFIRRVVDSLQQNRDVCANCPNLFETEKLPEPDAFDAMRFTLVAINHHRYICNCKCVYCPFWNNREARAPIDIFPAIVSLVKQDALSPKCNVNWGGGESTLLPEFESACTWIHRQGYWQSVHTNALRVSPAIETFLSARKGSVNISLDCGRAATYAKVKGVDRWDKVIKTLQAYRAACDNPNALEIKYIIFSQNHAPEEIAAFFDLCSSLDIRNVMYTFEGSEVATGRLHRDTLFAAAMFRHLAAERGMRCADYFVTNNVRRIVEDVQRQNFISSILNPN
jgi:sulfatase maturation enzyme AslB (radical SAM superfamily)